MDETFDAAYLEYLLSDAAVGDAMDHYDDLPAGQLRETLAWANDALEQYHYAGEALFDPQLWVM